MAKQQQVDNSQRTAQEKWDYYSRRVNDPKLTEGQRKHAARRLNDLSRGGKSNNNRAPVPTNGGNGNYTPEQQQAYHCGAAYGLAKTGKQMRVKDENKSSWQAGVKAGRAGKYAKK